MDDEVTVAEVAWFLDHDLWSLEKALLWVGVIEGKSWLAATMCIDVFVRQFEIPPEIEEQLRDVETFAYNISHSYWDSGFYVTLLETKKKVDDLLAWFSNQYPQAGIWNLRRR